MGQLIVRGLPDEVIQRLKERAARHGWSAEEEHRRLLTRALLSEGLGEYLKSMPDVGEDDDFERPREYPRDVNL
jgi:antitoxin FitA